MKGEDIALYGGVALVVGVLGIVAYKQLRSSSTTKSFTTSSVIQKQAPVIEKPLHHDFTASGVPTMQSVIQKAIGVPVSVQKPVSLIIENREQYADAQMSGLVSY